MDTLAHPTFEPKLLHHYIEPAEEFSGRCPRCRRVAPYVIDFRKDHYAVCPADRLAWWVGSNLVTTYWRMEDADLLALFGTTDRERLASEAGRELDGYQIVGG